MVKPSAQILRELFSYDPATGVVTRRVDVGCRIKAGAIVGKTLNKTHGYRTVGIEGKTYLLHHVIWCMETGEWPSDQIDHRDGVRSNNRWRNLREASNGQNQQNTKIREGTICGLTGVRYSPSRKKNPYRATITADGVVISLGSFATPGEAHAAYLRAKRELHTFQRTLRAYEQKPPIVRKKLRRVK